MSLSSRINASLKRIAAVGGLVVVLAIPAAADPVLWHISDEDSEIYLFGTIHILPSDLEWRTDAIQAALERSDTIWFEAPANDPAQQFRMARLIQELGLNRPNNPLSAQIGGDVLAKLSEIIPESGLTLAGLEQLRPWLGAVTLTLAFIQSQGYDPESGVESVLWPIAKDAGKNLKYFETLEEQVRFFADLPRELEIAYFEQTVFELADAPRELNELIRAWASGDIGRIDQIMNRERHEAPQVYETLIVQRNLSWVDEIRSLLDGAGSHFIALGAGHLAGADSVVELLRSRGIEVAGP